MSTSPSESLRVDWNYAIDQATDRSRDLDRTEGVLSLTVFEDEPAFGPAIAGDDALLHATVVVERTVGETATTVLDAEAVIRFRRRGNWLHVTVETVGAPAGAPPLLAMAIREGTALYVRSEAPRLAGLRGGTYGRPETRRRCAACVSNSAAPSGGLSSGGWCEHGEDSAKSRA